LLVYSVVQGRLSHTSKTAEIILSGRVHGRNWLPLQTHVTWPHLSFVSLFHSRRDVLS